jgi:hypothetical protein
MGDAAALNLVQPKTIPERFDLVEIARRLPEDDNTGRMKGNPQPRASGRKLH